MKKIYFPVIAVIFLLVSGLASCKKGDFFRPTSTNNLNETTVFTDSANSVSFLAGIYSNIGFSFKYDRFIFDPLGKAINTGGLEAACDEAETANSNSSTALAFATGTINAYLVTDDAYKKCYQNIRAANVLMKNAPNIPVAEGFKKQMVAEARFLRAWYYFTLLKHYGGMPIVGDTIFDYTDKLPAKRATFRATVNYIVSECDAAATVLPYQQAGPQYGRVSGGACAALKSRVLLYAASKLFNGTTLATGELGSIVGYPNDSLGRWGMARDAALAVMNTGQYSLNVDNSKPGKGFQDLFPKRINSEYILNLMFENNTYIENLFFPPSRDGRNGSFPYQGLVDAFPMANGKSITDPTSGYDATKPYNNRDPRLAFSVIRDSSLVLFRTPNGLAQTATPISIFVRPDGTSSGQDAFPTGTRTGYYNFKMADPAAVPSTFFALSSRCIPLIRYAEILLNYAEAQNEFNGGPDQSVYDALFKIRDRAGIAKGNGSYGLKVPMSQTEMRDAIRNERRIELAFEEQRFWDVRRWMIADQTDNIEAKGMKVTRANQAAAPTYEIVTIKRHNFRKAMYLWPLPQKEIDKSAQLLQNPGY